LLKRAQVEGDQGLAQAGVAFEEGEVAKGQPEEP
jgi:hypothetical protein